MRHNILIVGAGELGSRYLQGLKKVPLNSNIYIVDINKNSLKLSKKRWDSIKIKHFHKCFYYIKLPNKVINFDLVIVSSTANVRLKIIQNILNKYKVKNWILEKLLAQNSIDVLKIHHLLKNSNAWVNTCDKTFKWFKKIKSYKTKVKKSNFEVKGNGWGIISNSIHLIDFYEWWTNEKLLKVDANKLNKKWFNTKRKGFIETTGSIYCAFSKGSTLNLECKNNKSKPSTQKYLLDDWKINKFKGYAKKNSGLVIKGELDPMSNIVTEYVVDILVNGKCELTDLKNSSRIHRLYLDALLKNWNCSGNAHKKIFNIT